MNEITIFENLEFGKVRVVTLDGDPWFVGNDVAGILGYRDSSESIRKIVQKADLVPFGIDDGQNRYLISESGVRAMASQSNSLYANKLLAWLMSEYESHEKDLGNRSEKRNPKFGWKHVYAVQFDDGSVKIGISEDVRTRSLSLQRGSGKKIVNVFCTDSCSNAREIEKHIHEVLGASKIQGEWFSADFDAACKCVNDSFSEMAEFEDYDGSRVTEFVDAVKDYVASDGGSRMPFSEYFEPIRTIRVRNISAEYAKGYAELCRQCANLLELEINGLAYE